LKLNEQQLCWLEPLPLKEDRIANGVYARRRRVQEEYLAMRPINGLKIYFKLFYCKLLILSLLK